MQDTDTEATLPPQ